MKAVVYTEYGPPEVLELKEVEKPSPEEGAVLVKVHASSVNWADWHLLRAEPFLLRLAAGLLKPKDQILGVDVAGQVESVGKNAKQFQPGDEIYGSTYDSGFGAFAEYVCVPEGALAPKPTNLSFEEAAAVPATALTALQALRDQGQIQPGQKVLIHGASGGIGTFAVQLAKYFETEVTGVCSTRNLEMVRSLGADHVIDYTKEDFTESGQRYDLIIDNVGNPSIYRRFHKRSLSPDGVSLIIAGSFFLRFVSGPWMSRTSGNRIFTFESESTRKEDLALMKEILEGGKVVPVIDRRYPLHEVPEAIRYLEQGHAQGKVVIIVQQNST